MHQARRFFAVVLFFASTAVPVAAQELVVDPGRSIFKSEVSGQSVERVSFAVETDGVYLMTARQNQVDITLRVAASGLDLKVDSALRRDGDERLLFEAVAGRAELVVSAPNYTGLAGVVEIYLKRIDDVSATKMLSALKSETAGNFQPLSGGKEDWGAALTHHNQAFVAWGRVGNLKEQAWSRYSSAMILYWHLWRWQDAADVASDAMRLFEQLGDVRMRANARALYATALMEVAYSDKTGRTEQALARIYSQAQRELESAAQTHRGAGRLYEYAQALNNIGLNFHYQEKWDQAIDYYWRSAQQFESLGERIDEQMPLSNISVVAIAQGRFSTAVASNEGILAALDEMNAEDQSSLRADILTDLAFAHNALGQFESALAAFSVALELHLSTNNLSGRARAFSGLATVYSSLGDHRQAHRYFEQAYAMRSHVEEGRAGFSALVALAQSHRVLGDTRMASTLLEQAISSTSSKRNLARAHCMLGEVNLQLDLPAHAAAGFRAGLRASDAVGTASVRAQCNLGLGEALATTAADESAIRALESARDQFAGLGLVTGEARALMALSSISQRKGDYAAGLENIRRAIALVESSRARILNPGFRGHFLATLHSAYEQHWTLLLASSVQARELGEAESAKALLREALVSADTGRARELQEYLQETGGDPNRRSDGNEFDELRESLLERLYQRELIDRARDDGESIDAQSAHENESRIAQLSAKIDLLDSSVNPATLAMAHDVLDLNEAQSYLPDDVTIVEYALGTNGSVAFVLTKDSINVVALPARATVNAMATAALDQLVDAPGVRSEDAVGQLAQAAVWPVLGMVKTSRLVLVSDGALQYLPFSALPLPNAPDGQRLIDDYEISGASSIQTWLLQNKRALGRVAARKRIALFADPVYSAQDSRLDLAAATSSTARSSGMLTTVRGDRQFSRLLYSGVEARSIIAAVDLDASDRLAATDLQANKALVMSGDLSSYQILHFATHGIVDTQFPHLSAIALSMTDSQGRAIDGHLRLREIKSLTLSADLVVLSACETYLGAEIRGEGLQSLARGFSIAGATQVVASLWRVPDSSTAKLMAEFHRRMAHHQESPATALREAQLALSRNALTRHPYHWAGFMIFGPNVVSPPET